MKNPILKIAPLCAVVFCFAFPVSAAAPEEIDQLASSIGTEELIEIIRDEGLLQAADLREGMFPDASASRWDGLLNIIYDQKRLARTFRKTFDEELAEADLSPLLDYFGSDAGKKIIRLEIDARRAIMEPDVEQVAREVYLERAIDGGPRLDLLESFEASNDLIENNVMGAMNASLAFYRGLADGGAFEMTEDDMLREVWGQEVDIRQDSIEWLYGYMLMAYEPLLDGELQAYVDLSETEAGRVLNLALFAGFDAVFDEVSYALGRGAAEFIVGEDI